MKTGLVPGTLIIIIAIVSAIASLAGIFSDGGSGPYQHTSVRGHEVTIYGVGLYKDMSAGVAPQGIAQDHITLFVGIPFLVVSFLVARGGSLRGLFLLAGTLGYFLVTYLFYLVMGMYNSMYVGYIILLSASFFSFLLTMRQLAGRVAEVNLEAQMPTRFSGGFLIFNSVVITLLWLSIIVPPLTDGSIVPLEAEHYTTLVVQGLDLAVLLPAGFMSGLLFYRKKPAGYLFGPVYLVFLSLLMSALSAKVLAMAMLNYNVMPAILIIPAFNVISISCAYLVLRNVREDGHSA